MISFYSLFSQVKINGTLYLGSFKWDNCNATAPLKLNSLTISPDPLQLSGDVTVSFDATVGINVSETNDLNAKVIMKKKVRIMNQSMNFNWSIVSSP